MANADTKNVIVDTICISILLIAICVFSYYFETTNIWLYISSITIATISAIILFKPKFKDEDE